MRVLCTGQTVLSSRAVTHDAVRNLLPFYAAARLTEPQADEVRDAAWGAAGRGCEYAGRHGLCEPSRPHGGHGRPVDRPRPEGEGWPSRAAARSPPSRAHSTARV